MLHIQAVLEYTKGEATDHFHTNLADFVIDALGKPFCDLCACIW